MGGYVVQCGTERDLGRDYDAATGKKGSTNEIV